MLSTIDTAAEKANHNLSWTSHTKCPDAISATFVEPALACAANEAEAISALFSASATSLSGNNGGLDEDASSGSEGRLLDDGTAAAVGSTLEEVLPAVSCSSRRSATALCGVDAAGTKTRLEKYGAGDSIDESILQEGALNTTRSAGPRNWCVLGLLFVAELHPTMPLPQAGTRHAVG